MAARIDSSVSVRLLSQLAGEEAAARGHNGIEPEHYVLAALKLTSFPDMGVSRISPGDPLRARLAAELEALRRVFEAHAIDPSEGLRRLDSELVVEGYPLTGGSPGDSERSQRLFAALGGRGRSFAFGADELIEAILTNPSHTIRQALRLRTGQPSYLSSQCWDWTQMARDGELRAPERRGGSLNVMGGTRIGGLPTWLSSESIALIHALARGTRGCVFLITEDCYEAGEPVSETAFAAIEGNVPGSLVRKRFLILPSEKSAGLDSRAERELFLRLTSEAESLGDVVLYIEGLDSPSADREQQRCEALAVTVLNSDSWCICGISPRAYEGMISVDSSWRTCSSAIWLTPNGLPEEIPWEL
jgi:hypothetical protein